MQRRSYRERVDARRQVRRRRAARLVTTPVSPRTQTRDPLARPKRRGGLLVWLGLALLGLFAHVVVLAAFWLVGGYLVIEDSGRDLNERIEVTVVQPAPEPEPAEVPEPVVEPPPPEPEPEVVRAEPKPKPKPKPEPKPKKAPEPVAAEPPPDPIDLPPPEAEPPAEPPPPRRRIVGLSLESTVAGGGGPSFAVGNTRMGTTATTAAKPEEVKPLDKRVAAPTPNRVATRVPVAGVVLKKPKRISSPEPAYPPLLREQGIEANVVLSITIAPDGSVGEARVVKGAGYPEFDEAALESARRQRYRPATRDGAPIAYTLEYTVRFRLNEA